MSDGPPTRWISGARIGKRVQPEQQTTAAILRAATRREIASTIRPGIAGDPTSSANVTSNGHGRAIRERRHTPECALIRAAAASGASRCAMTATRPRNATTRHAASLARRAAHHHAEHRRSGRYAWRSASSATVADAVLHAMTDASSPLLDRRAQQPVTAYSLHGARRSWCRVGWQAARCRRGRSSSPSGNCRPRAP